MRGLSQYTILYITKTNLGCFKCRQFYFLLFQAFKPTQMPKKRQQLFLLRMSNKMSIMKPTVVGLDVWVGKYVHKLCQGKRMKA